MFEITTDILSSFSKLSGVITNSNRIFIATPPFQLGGLNAPLPDLGQAQRLEVGGGEMSISQPQQ